MKIRQMQALRALVQTGTTSGAAQLLHMTQSAASKLVTQLESELSVHLFDRLHGRLVMTPEGRTIYEDIERILAAIDDLQAKTQDIGALNEGAIRIGAMPALAYGLVPRTIKRFVGQYPRIRCVADVVGRKDVEDGVAIGRYDLGLVTLPLQNDILNVLELASVDAVCVLPRGHRLARARRIVAEDLAGEVFISVDPDALLRHRIDTLFGERRVRRSMQLQAGSTVLACHMVASGIGASIVHPLIAFAFKSILAIRRFEPSVTLDYALVRRQGPGDRLTDAFTTLAQEEMAATKSRLGLSRPERP
jgi:DNA-binding transcriptional LysR family regulator